MRDRNPKIGVNQTVLVQITDRIFDSYLCNMADESIQKPDGENSEEQGEARNDVVVKIGLVGDAQVISPPWTFRITYILTSIFSSI